MSDDLVQCVERYLAGQALKNDEDKLIQNGVFLALLVRRKVSTRTRVIRIHPSDPDAARLLRFLVEPGLAPELATVTRQNRLFRGHILRITPDWDRIARYFGKSVVELEIVLRRYLPPVVRRHRDTFDYLLRNS
ncbi:MAG: hypothetical protein EPO21_13410 [Chloroflexota bacterium]|nr:MAG: hypothetical protein EPO21_13410 [Chloroflexota bacterium]